MSAFHQFLKTLENKTVSVIGMGVSNTPFIHLLLEENIPVIVRDKNPDTTIQKELENKGAIFQTGDEYLHNLSEDIIYRTPGLSPNTPELVTARNNGSTISSEMQVFFNLCPCPIIAITGSDGKTTTTSIIAKFLEATGKTIFLGGNIGKPLLPEIIQITPDDIAVLELSSFQLMDLECSPTVAVVTNLSPNHLDYHKTMDEYVTSKTNIFTKQNPDQKVVLNADNIDSIALLPLVNSKMQCFSRLKDTSVAFLKNHIIHLKQEDKETPYLPLSAIQLKGVHNIENFMAAILAVEDFCTPEQIRQVAENFHGVAHRMEFIRELHGVSYYNDSIGTSPTRTIAGLHSFEQRMILIAGGYDKGIPFFQLGEEIHAHVKHLVLNGATATAISSAVQQGEAVFGDTGQQNKKEGILETTSLCDTLDDAFAKAVSLAKEGDVIVLSPACAAFDQFKNFAQRGDYFRSLVEGLS